MSGPIFVYADDAKQSSPNRKGLGPLVAYGGLVVCSSRVKALQFEIEELCRAVGIPEREQFKWSPGKNERALKHSLHGEQRTEFFVRCLEIAGAQSCEAIVCIVDTACAHAMRESPSHELDALSLFLERAESAVAARASHGMLFLAQPEGGSRNATELKNYASSVLSRGTAFRQFEMITRPVHVVPSREWRLLQISDLIVSATLAEVAGGGRWSAPVFEAVAPLLRSSDGQRKGFGLKIHPDARHWRVCEAVLRQAAQREQVATSAA